MVVIGLRCSIGGLGVVLVEGYLFIFVLGLNRVECVWKVSIKERMEVVGVVLCFGRRIGLRLVLGLG